MDNNCFTLKTKTFFENITLTSCMLVIITSRWYVDKIDKKLDFVDEIAPFQIALELTRF